MPDDVYHSIPYMNASSLKNANTSLQHFWANWINNPNRAPFKVTPALTFGSAVHCAILEAERFTQAYACLPEGTNLRTKDGKALKAEMEEAGATILNDSDMETIDGIRTSLQADKFGSHIFAKGKSEVTLIWVDEATGLYCKARADFINDTYVADLKTCEDASERGFGSSIWKYGYYIQAAFYMMGCAALGLNKQQFLFQAIEKKPPYATTTHFLDKAYIDFGEFKVRQLMTSIAENLKDMEDGKPMVGYSEKPIKHEIPRWANDAA